MVPLVSYYFILDPVLYLSWSVIPVGYAMNLFVVYDEYPKWIEKYYLVDNNSHLELKTQLFQWKIWTIFSKLGRISNIDEVGSPHNKSNIDEVADRGLYSMLDDW